MRTFIVLIISAGFIGIGAALLLPIPIPPQTTQAPTINCTNFEFDTYCRIYDPIAKAFLEPPVNDVVVAGVTRVAKANGCWCQNNGLGPSDPTWLTCDGLLGDIFYLTYKIQDFFNQTDCHCMCPQ